MGVMKEVGVFSQINRHHVIQGRSQKHREDVKLITRTKQLRQKMKKKTMTFATSMVVDTAEFKVSPKKI